VRSYWGRQGTRRCRQPAGGSRREQATETLDDFHRARAPLLDVPKVATEVGEALDLQLLAGASTDAELFLTSSEPGLRYVDLQTGDKRRARIACLFDLPLRDLAERRAASCSRGSVRAN